MPDSESRDSTGTRERILDAALECAAEDGLGSVTNRRLASRAGVSLGTLTYHFQSQADVVREALARFVEGEVRRLEAIAETAGASTDPASALVAVQQLLSGDSGRRLAKLELYVASARDESLRAAAERCFAAYDEIVAHGLKTVGVEPTETVVRATVALIDGLQLRRLALADAGELEVADAVGLLIAGAVAGS